MNSRNPRLYSQEGSLLFWALSFSKGLFSWRFLQKIIFFFCIRSSFFKVEIRLWFYILSDELFLFSGNLILTNSYRSNLNLKTAFLWNCEFEKEILMKLWKVNLNGHEIMNMKKTFSWNHEYENDFSMKQWVWNRKYHEIMNMKSIFLWKREFEMACDEM